MVGVGDPHTGFTAAQVALLLVAVQYAVLAPGWVVAGVMLPGERRSALWCAAYAGATGLGLALIVLGMLWDLPAPRAMGNVLSMAGMLALQRGIWTFSGRPTWPRTQVAVLVAAMALSTTASWSEVRYGPLRIAGVSLLWGALYLWAARDVWLYVHREPRQRLGLLCVMPLLAGAVLLLVRAGRAMVAPDQVVDEVMGDSWLSVGSAVLGLVAALVLQLALVGLLVARMVGRMDRLSRHDALTGLLNRRAIDQVLQQEEHRVRRLHGRMSVLLLDIDHFKRVNDTLGHAAGDHALQHVAAVMAANLRQIDHLARWGGEEFVAMLPATSGDEAVVLAERLRDRIRAVPVVVDGQRVSLTASIGVASWQGPADSRDAMMARADEALYRAKRSGRDCVRRAATETLRERIAEVA